MSTTKIYLGMTEDGNAFNYAGELTDFFKDSIANRSASLFCLADDNRSFMEVTADGTLIPVSENPFEGEDSTEEHPDGESGDEAETPDDVVDDE